MYNAQVDKYKATLRNRRKSGEIVEVDKGFSKPIKKSKFYP